MLCAKMEMLMKDRIEKVRWLLEAGDVDAILVSGPYNRRYLTGFRAMESTLGESAGHALVTRNNAYLFTNLLHSEQAKIETSDVEVVTYQSEPYECVATVLQGDEVKKLGFEGDAMAVRDYLALSKAMDHEVELIDMQTALAPLRAVKDEDELAKIRRAVEVADAAFNYVSARLVDGITERDVAWVLEKYMRDKGAEGVAFDTIVASGPNGALPHAIPGDRVIEEGEAIVIDMGATVEGYRSDLTRTLCLGTPDARFRSIYDIVLKANLAAEAQIRAGQTGMEADGIARKIIDEAGYGAEFYHSLGHGVGLAVHESPTLRKKCETVLEENMVVTIEPGIYIPGWGGVRIEDTVIIKADGVEVLTKAPKEVTPG